MTGPDVRRGLVLAGGGIRVAWQTGVVTALSEAGLTFAHVDGSSGGIFTTAMLLSGNTVDEMAEHWRSLDIHAFVSPLPLRGYLKSPTNWAAFGGSRGIRKTVLPHLGINLARVRAATTPTGTFNVADFATKTCVAVPHTDIDEDLLIAGVSLAGVMPAVEYDGRAWTDAVWIKDANLTETARRGCTELWVAWCIANNPRWGTGALEQYVHMIELSAVGGLTAELTWIADLNERRRRGEAICGSTEPVVVHLIKPMLPIPLDPDFVVGRIDAETLIAMGYRDAWRYLEQPDPDGIALDERATATAVRPLGCRVVLRADGTLGSGATSCTIVLEADDLEALATDGAETMSAVGALRHPQHGYRMFTSATAVLDGTGASRRLRATCRLRLDGRPHTLTVEVPLPAWHWSAARTHRWTLRTEDGHLVDTGEGHMSAAQARRAVTSFEPSGAHSLGDRGRAVLLAARRLRWHAS
jgi:NTE family protein